jgi:hypothetical protein
MTGSGRGTKTMVGMIFSSALPGANDAFTLIRTSLQENPRPIAG